MIGVNWLAVLLAVVAAMAIGAAWFSPVLFAKSWVREMGKTHDQLGNPITSMVNAVIMYLISAIAMSLVFAAFRVETVLDGLKIAAVVWIGFAGSMQLLVDRFQGRSVKLSIITAGNTLVAFLAMGAILAAMG
jgi:hypothetical protein